MGIKMVLDNRNYGIKVSNDDEAWYIIKNAQYILNDVLAAKGFLYMMDVYKYLGMPWGDDWKNELCRNNEKIYYVAFENIHKNEDGQYEFEICLWSN